MKKILTSYNIVCLICSILIAVTANVYAQREKYYDVVRKLEGTSGQGGLILRIKNINDGFTNIFDQAKITVDALINALEGGRFSMDEFRTWLRKSIQDSDTRSDLQDITDDCRRLAKDMNDVIESFDEIIKEHKYPDAYFKKIEACLLVHNTEEALRTYEDWKRAGAPIPETFPLERTTITKREEYEKEVDTTTIRDMFYNIATAYLHQGIVSSGQIPKEGTQISQESPQTPDVEVIRSYIELKRKILQSKLQDDKIDETEENNLRNELIGVDFELAVFYAENGRQNKARDEYESMRRKHSQKLGASVYASVRKFLDDFEHNRLQNLNNCFVSVEVDPELNGSSIRLAYYPESVEGKNKSLGLWLGGKQIAAIHLPRVNAEQSEAPLSSIHVQLVNEITTDEEHNTYSLIVTRRSIEESISEKTFYCTIKLPAIEVWQPNKIPLEIKLGRKGYKEQSDLLKDNATLTLPERAEPMQIKGGSVEKLTEGIHSNLKINLALVIEEGYQDEYQLSVHLKRPNRNPIITGILLASMLASSIILRLL